MNRPRELVYTRPCGGTPIAKATSSYGAIVFLCWERDTVSHGWAASMKAMTNSCGECWKRYRIENSQPKKYPIKSLAVNLGMSCIVAEDSVNWALLLKVIRRQGGAFGVVGPNSATRKTEHSLIQRDVANHRDVLFSKL
jgi:hypothetical protein